MLPVLALWFALAPQASAPPTQPPSEIPATQAPLQASPVTARPSPASPIPDASGAYYAGHGVTPPYILYKVQSGFIEAGRRNTISRNVLLTLIVDEHGKPVDIHVVPSSPDKVAEEFPKAALSLDRAAVDDATRWRYAPGKYQGKPVRVRMTAYFQCKRID